MKRVISLFVTFAVLCLGSPKRTAKPQPIPILCGEPNSQPRRITYVRGHGERISVMPGWDTVIFLPKDAVVSDALLGDPDQKTDQKKSAWVITVHEDKNYFSIRPRKAGLKTDLTVISKDGDPFVLLLSDISQQPGAHADTTVLIQRPDDADNPDAQAKFATKGDLEALTSKVDGIKATVDTQDAKLTQGLDAAKKEAVLADAGTARHYYKFDQKTASKQPFAIQSHEAIWNNGKYTFARSGTSELPALYEFKDGKPAVTNWNFRDGVYFVPHIVTKGELRIGKKKLIFTAEGDRG